MSKFGLSFDPVFPLWAVGLIVGIAFAFFIWKEFQRKQRFLIARIIAQVLILTSILGLLLKPSFKEEKPSLKNILLTKGYDKSKADSLLKIHPTLKIYRTEEAESFPLSESLNENQNLSNIGEETLFVLGSGLSSDELDLVGNRNFQFLPGNIPLGITQLFIEKPIRANESAYIRGVLNTNENVVLKLSAFGTEDSVSLKGKGLVPFSFSTKPKQQGLFVCTISSKGDNPVNEKLPIEVVPEQKLKILVLQKFPTAEIRYLKNYLAEKGHAIALRYQTSKNNFKYEYANTASSRIDKITPELAESIDLLFIDSSVLTGLSSSEKNALGNAIQNGLGMIILEIPEKEKTISQFLPISVKQIALDTVHIKLSDSKLHVLPAQSIEITPDPSIRPVTTHRERILSGYHYNGAGKVAFQLLSETYKIRLEGNVDDYSTIWSTLIEYTARSKNEKFKMSINNPFPYYTDESVSMEIISSGTKPTLLSDKTLLPLTEDVIIDDLWKAKTWAGNSGWHQFSIKEDSTELHYFVSAKEDWKALRFSNQVRENLLAQSSVISEIRTINKYETKEISQVIFYFIFLIAAGFLWLAPKI